MTSREGAGRIGSGFLAVKDGLCFTAWHVVRDAKTVFAKFSDGEEYESSGIIDKDELRDVALIKLKVHGRPLLEVSGDYPEVGANAYVIGTPKGLEFSISDGLVSQIETVGGQKSIQFTCPASGGSSGGPIIDARGFVLGIVKSQLVQGQNLNFAAPAAYALGLDATLPTTPWELVHTSIPASGPAKQAPAIDDATALTRLASLFTAISDARTAIDWTETNVTERMGGFTSGVPPIMYEAQQLLEPSIDSLVATTCATNEIETVRMGVMETAFKLRNIVKAAIEAIRSAEASGGWNAAVKDKWAQMLALAAGANLSQSGLQFAKLKDNRLFLDSLSPELAETTTGSLGYRLGVSYMHRRPTLLLMVNKGSVAERIGLQPMDLIMEVDGKPLSTLLTFKEAVKKHAGENIEIRVLRKNKPTELHSKVPQEVSGK